MRHSLRVLLLAGAAAFATIPMQGQQATAASGGTNEQQVDVAFTYSPAYSNLTNTTSFWSQGGGAEISATVYHGLGIAADINGTHATNIGGSGVNLNMVNTLFGPRYKWSPRSHRYSVFGQGLIGESHGFDSVFTDTAGAQTSASSFALQVGGGFDWSINRRFAVRPIEANWLRTQFSNAGTNVQNNMRLGAGVVLHLR